MWNGDLANCWAQVWVKFRDFNCCRLEQFAHNLLVHHPSGQVSEVHFTDYSRNPFLGFLPFSGSCRWQEPLVTKRLNIEACQLPIVRGFVALRPSNPDGPVLKLEPTHLHGSRCEDIVHELHKSKHPFALRREVKGTYDIDNVWVSLHETGKIQEKAIEGLSQHWLIHLVLWEIAHVQFSTLLPIRSGIQQALQRLLVRIRRIWPHVPFALPLPQVRS
mmetsp:Transcript_67492/g.158362  ORF Transcript_67492/g.158362 Transcript_67492/m.158362 type:complete len:218 (-) Transcript_67492:62-715(-)